MADRLGVDLVFAHHPEGKALINLWKVMEIHREALIADGVSVNVAERVVEERQDEIKRAFHGSNYNRACDAARVMEMSFLNLHTPADNLANKAMKEFVENGRYKTIKEFIEAALEIEEYKDAARYGVKPKVLSGSENNSVRKKISPVTSIPVANCPSIVPKLIKLSLCKTLIFYRSSTLP